MGGSGSWLFLRSRFVQQALQVGRETGSGFGSGALVSLGFGLWEVQGNHFSAVVLLHRPEYLLIRIAVKVLLPSNNRADNLEWTTYKGNMQHAARQGRMKGVPENLKKAQAAKEIPVFAIKDGAKTWYRSGADAGRILGVSSGHVAAACRKEYGYKTVGGYEFEYADKELQSRQRPNRKSRQKEEVIRELRERMMGNTIMNGRKLSKETKEKLSRAAGRPVAQFDKPGKFIAEYISANDAKKKTGISHINSCANGDRKSAGGYIWKWKG